MIINIRPNTFIESNTVTHKKHSFNEQLNIINNILYIKCQYYSKLDVLIKTNEKIQLLLSACMFDKNFREHFTSILIEMFPTIKHIKVKGFNPIKILCFNVGNIIVTLFNFLRINDISIEDFLLDSRYAIVVNGTFKKRVKIVDLLNL